MEITDLQNQIVQVENYQSTFITLKINNQLFRFDFFDKREFNLRKGTIGELQVFEDHPLLIDYNENILTTYINSKPDDFKDFIAEFENEINVLTKGWRSWRNYILELDIFFNNVKNGRGKLSEAPFSITERIIKICDKFNVKTKTFGNELIIYNYKLMVISDNYVIAKEFRSHNN